MLMAGVFDFPAILKGLEVVKKGIDKVGKIVPLQDIMKEIAPFMIKTLVGEIPGLKMVADSILQTL
jgi:hypothetical protein